MKNADLEFWRLFIDSRIQNGSLYQDFIKLLYSIFYQEMSYSLSTESKGEIKFFTLEQLKKLKKINDDPKPIIMDAIKNLSMKDCLQLMNIKKYPYDQIQRILSDEMIEMIDCEKMCLDIFEGPLRTWVPFENEPGFLKAMVTARKWLDKQEGPVTVEMLKALHEKCLSGVKKTNFDNNTKEKTGVFRSKGSSFDVNLMHNASLQGLEEYLNDLLLGERFGHFEFNNSKLGSKLILKCIDGKLMWSVEKKGSLEEKSFFPEKETSTAEHAKFIQKLFKEGWKCDFFINNEKIEILVENALNKYYEDLKKTESEINKLEITVKLIRFLAALHPFPDGVGRTIVVQLLPKLLRDLDFSECILDNPTGDFVFKNFQESMKAVREGLEAGKNKNFEKTTAKLLETLSLKQQKYFYECYEIYYGKEFIKENSIENYKKLFLLREEFLGLELRKAGANPKIIYKEFEKLLNEACEKNPNVIRMVGKSGRNLLHCVMQSGDPERVFLVLKKEKELIDQEKISEKNKLIDQKDNGTAKELNLELTPRTPYELMEAYMTLYNSNKNKTEKIPDMSTFIEQRESLKKNLNSIDIISQKKETFNSLYQ